MKVRIEQAPPEVWDTIWQSCDYSTYFHSREWAEVWQEYTAGRYTPHPLLVTFSDNKRLLFPLSKYPVHRGLNSVFISSPAGTYGGWLSQEALSETHIDALLRALKSQGYNLRWRANPYCPATGTDHKLVVENDITHALRLEQNFEFMQKKWAKGYRIVAKAKKAEREGVVVRQAKTQADWDRYYAVYESTLGRWGEGASAAYGRPFFSSLQAKGSAHIRLWLADYQQEVIAGALCFYAPKHVVYWHGAALAAFFHLRPVNLLMYIAIQNAYAGGYHWFDFNPSGGHEGVAAFKKSFGATELPCPIYEHNTYRYKFFKQIVGRLR